MPLDIWTTAADRAAARRADAMPPRPRKRPDAPVIALLRPMEITGERELGDDPCGPSATGSEDGESA